MFLQQFVYSPDALARLSRHAETGATLPADGLAGLWGAGYWGNRWEYRPDASYLECHA